ncbi:lytic transglycosylase domain-containing protein [Uliginosibacterium gangwonense]|uniref:lytic transglycosylase domain-containing protein n=1 Tax=Uliginosibacterium gangwonense TaxID=392736 RepID=UPI00037BEBC0|nr:lytic transglycosylase domain-containing protein [Uliginosibacterium gangwonense]
MRSIKTHLARAFIIAATLLLTQPLYAATDCFQQAATYHHVNYLVLRAIAWQESRGHPDAVHVNHNGSTDYGMMQINSIHLPELSHYGITRQHLMNSCSSVYIGAWHLRRMMNKYGNNWKAVGAYHSESASERDKYSNSIKALIDQLGTQKQVVELRTSYR